MTYLVTAIILLLAGFVLRTNLRSKGKNALASLILTGAIVLSVGAVALSCVQSVPTGHTGVVTTFGKVENTTLDSGVHFVLPWQKVVKMDNRVQKQTADLSCFSSDIQEVNLTYTINYQIKKSDAQNIYRTIGVDYYQTVIQPCITESVKVVTARYTAEQLVGKRNELAAAIEDDLAEKLLNYNIELVSTSIENMDFTNAFTDAVEAKQVAEQNKLKAAIEQEQMTIEAQAAAERAVLEAQSKLEVAKLEAEANEALEKSFSDKLLQYYYIQRWNGQLPQYVGEGFNFMIGVQ